MVRKSADDAERLRRVFVARETGDTTYLIDALVDPELRYAAAGFLGELGEPIAVQPLIRLLAVRDVHVRRVAAEALGKLGDAQAMPCLIAVARSDPDRATRSWAIGALADLGGEDAVPVLAACLRDPSRWNRRYTVKRLGELGDQRALPELEKAMKAEPLPWRRPYRLAIRQIRARRNERSTPAPLQHDEEGAAGTVGEP